MRERVRLNVRESVCGSSESFFVTLRIVNFFSGFVECVVCDRWAQELISEWHWSDRVTGFRV